MGYFGQCGCDYGVFSWLPGIINGYVFRSRKEDQSATLECPLTPPVTLQSAHATITMTNRTDGT